MRPLVRCDPDIYFIVLFVLNITCWCAMLMIISCAVNCYLSDVVHVESSHHGYLVSHTSLNYALNCYKKEVEDEEEVEMEEEVVDVEEGTSYI